MSFKKFFPLTIVFTLCTLSNVFSQQATDTLLIQSRVNKSLHKLNTKVKLTQEQHLILVELFFKKEDLRLKMKVCQPNSTAYRTLRSDWIVMKKEIEMVLTDEQQRLLKKHVQSNETRVQKSKYSIEKNNIIK